MNKTSPNSRILLFEIIMSVSIFAAAGIIAVYCFGIARFTQIRANDKAMAGAIIQSDFEIIKSLNSIDKMNEFLYTTYGEKESENTNTYIKHFDENWIQKNGNEYTVTITIGQENLKSGVLTNISISAEKGTPYPFIKKGGEQIYFIESKKFFPEFGGAHE